MKYFPLLCAALWRNPAETLLTWLASTFAFTLFGLMVGVYAHTRHMIDLQRMDRAVVVMRYPDQPYTGLPAALAGQIAQIKGVTAVGTGRSLFGYHIDQRHPARAWAVDEGMARGWPEVPLTLRDWQKLFAVPDGIFVSPRAAQRWNLHVGDTFQLTTPANVRADGSSTWIFHVLGITQGELAYFDDALIVANHHYVDNSMPPAQRGLGNNFNIALTDPAHAAEICRAIDQRFGNSGTPTFSVPLKADAQALANTNIDIAATTLSVAAAGLFMVLFLIANVIARSVSERYPELAVLQTLGFRESHLGCLLVAEATTPCLLGALLGTAISYLLTRFSIHLLAGPLGRLLSTPDLAPAVLAWSLGSALLLALGSSIVPLLRLRSLNVVDALAGR